MKRISFGILLSVCVFALLASPVLAQLAGEPVRANIPFDFNVNGRILPAGDYEISRMNDEGGLKITNVAHSRDHAIFETDSVQRLKTSRGELIFHRHGESYFLYEVWAPGTETGRELPTSKQERLIKRETASNATANSQQLVAIAIN